MKNSIGATRRLQEGSDAAPAFVASVLFCEFDSGTLAVLSRYERYLNLTSSEWLGDGAAIAYDRIAHRLDHVVGLEEQAQFIPGGGGAVRVRTRRGREDRGAGDVRVGVRGGLRGAGAGVGDAGVDRVHDFRVARSTPEGDAVAAVRLFVLFFVGTLVALMCILSAALSKLSCLRRTSRRPCASFARTCLPCLPRPLRPIRRRLQSPPNLHPRC